MNDVRFIHTDHWRLADTVSGLAGTPEWLRRLARDATRSSVHRTMELATAHHVDFLFLAGRCTETPRFSGSVAAWLESPFQLLRKSGIRIVMAESGLAVLDRLADVLLRPDEDLVVGRRDGNIHLTAAPRSKTNADVLVLTSAQNTTADITDRSCVYVFEPKLRHEISQTQQGQVVHSAGVTQAVTPEETGPCGCLLVTCRPESNDVSATFMATDTVRFESRSLDFSDLHSQQDICSVIVRTARQLAQPQFCTTVVDWVVNISDDADDRTHLPEILSEQHMLEQLRDRLQTGHSGVWPRRVNIRPRSQNFSKQLGTEGHRAFRSVLLEQHSPDLRTTWEQFVTGTRLLNRAA